MNPLSLVSMESAFLPEPQCCLNHDRTIATLVTEMLYDIYANLGRNSMYLSVLHGKSVTFQCEKSKMTSHTFQRTLKKTFSPKLEDFFQFSSSSFYFPLKPARYSGLWIVSESLHDSVILLLNYLVRSR